MQVLAERFLGEKRLGEKSSGEILLTPNVVTFFRGRGFQMTQFERQDFTYHKITRFLN